MKGYIYTKVFHYLGAMDKSGENYPTISAYNFWIVRVGIYVPWTNVRKMPHSYEQ